jgi:excisionase family DNA binding protein
LTDRTAAQLTLAPPPNGPTLRPLGLPLHSTDDRVMTAARYLGVSRWTVQRLRAQGEITGYRIGAAAMIELDSLDAYVARQQAKARAERGG